MEEVGPRQEQRPRATREQLPSCQDARSNPSLLTTLKKHPTEESPYLAAVSSQSVGQIKQFAPSANRNCAFILKVMKGLLHSSGKVLEIASGTGQHMAAFAQAHPDVEWIPSDPDPQARASIAAWTADTGVTNVREPKELDVTEAGWYTAMEDKLTGIVCINLLHISPWRACEGLMAGAEKLLSKDGFLYLYGPYMQDGRHTAPSNEEFDISLKHRNPEWGVRDVADVAACANAHGLVLDDLVEMPANNLSLVLRFKA